MGLDGSHISSAPKATFGDYLRIARPDHWFKNIFMLPGVVLALIMSHTSFTLAILESLIVGVASACLISSANYTINEWLDAEFDRHHPVKKHRPSAKGRMRAGLIYLQWLILFGAGLALAHVLSFQFFFYATLFGMMGLIYNVRPLRTKDLIYLDVLSESVNNPLRFMLGWGVVVSDIFPPSSILLAYWMGGAYLMAIKRYAEFRFIGDAEMAGRYRRSFRHYTEETLLLSAFFYALSSTFFLGVFLIKYRIEFILSVPFIALLFVWYLKIGMRADSVTQKPEKLYQETPFIIYVLFVSCLITVLFLVDIPWLGILVEHRALP